MFQSHDHHVKDEVCLTRPPYRNGKKLRAVKVYTIAQESKYLLIQNIPSIAGVVEQLLPYFNQYGKIEQYWRLDGYIRKDSTQGDEFFDTILIKFIQIQQARNAKCRLDDMNFMGSNLHVCYAPECENLDDLREKFNERRTIVQRRSEINNYAKGKKRTMNTFRQNKRKKQCAIVYEQSTLIPKTDLISCSTNTIESSSLQSFERTTNEIRTKMRDIVQKSNLIPIVLQQNIKKRKRLQI
ncbi:unnamed protein product [Rotaria sp. Silwood2]|nr:unnamed protein product [Rotaria sp. Silwood2]CAF2664903.1 unnamed protein product [Rotaria sp. Silwood2]CAF2912284.1 unnamed protein product [Rotaria sp. Silwood2]CAF3081253.1 unnamed protein product [Rotaria sp. Silwood2]CAF4080427.1 unnamed protein product [Rotaria sp. Silwood2]